MVDAAGKGMLDLRTERAQIFTIIAEGCVFLQNILVFRAVSENAG